MKRRPLPALRTTPRRKELATPRIKQAIPKDPEYLAWLRSIPGYACQKDQTEQDTHTEAHHPIRGRYSQAKAPDSQAIPLCARHHRWRRPESLSIHQNPIEFAQRYGAESEILAEILSM